MPNFAGPGTSFGAHHTTGLTLTPGNDGAARAELQRLEVHDVRCTLGGMQVHVARVQAAGLRADLRLASGAAPRIVALHADDLQLMGVELASAALPRAITAPSGPWHLEALGEMQGLLHAFITDAVWVVDAEVRLHLQQGGIDFNRATVEHVGPDSSMGISRGGVYVDSPKLGRQYLYLFTGPDLPGVRYETRGTRRGVTDRGHVDLRALAEGWLSRSLLTAPGKPANRHVEATLDRTRLTGELQFGDGAVGTPWGQVRLTGQAEGKNRLIVSAAVLSHKLVLRMPDVAASEAHFAAGGWSGTCGAVSADVSVRVSGLGSGSPEVVLALGHVKAQALQTHRDGSAIPTSSS